VTLKFLADELALSITDVESLLVDMILDGRVRAHIDQIKGFVTLGSDMESVEIKTLQSLAKWADILGNVTTGIANKTV
jgi:PCI domain